MKKEKTNKERDNLEELPPLFTHNFTKEKAYPIPTGTYPLFV